MGLGGGAQVEALDACVAFLLHCIVSGGAQVAARQLRRLLQREGGQTLSQRSKEQPWGIRWPLGGRRRVTRWVECAYAACDSPSRPSRSSGSVLIASLPSARRGHCSGGRSR